jgi:uncharacterized membrane protein YbaN (DUF454 family)
MKYLLIVAGTVAAGLGILGIFLPLLPTTPFLLLATACYAKSSPRLAEKLFNNKHLGQYLRDYKEKQGIKRSIKRRILIVLWLSLGASVIWSIFNKPWISIVLLCIGIVVTIHIRSIKTLDD